MTGFALPRGDIIIPTRSSDTVSPCGCHPARGVYCSLGEGWVRTYVDTVRLNDHYGDRLPLNIAVFTLSVHWGLDRAATLIALLNKPCFDRASAWGSVDVRSDFAGGVDSSDRAVRHPLRRIP